MSLAIQCRNVTKSFGEHAAKVMALRGVELEVSAGELMMLVGPSGCGKTTLISIIAGILSADEGEYTVLGEDLSTLRGNALLDFRAKNVGFIFQSFNLLPSITVEENVAIPLIINGMAHQQARDEAAKLLAEVGLEGRGRNLPGQLSGGQQQRVAIARAIVHKPKLLVCDEPTSALDHETGARIMELLQTLNRQSGTTMVVVTHDERIFPYADRIAHMDDGRIDRVVTNHNTKVKEAV